jgi:hypothetical protein
VKDRMSDQEATSAFSFTERHPRAQRVTSNVRNSCALTFAVISPECISARRGDHSLNQVLGYILNGVVTVAMIRSLALLIAALPAHRVTPQ